MQQMARARKHIHTKEATAAGVCSALVAKAFLILIWVYQHSLSIVLGPRCRFYPSCSRYAGECLQKYPLSVAMKKTSRRLLSCHPLHPGGIDLP